MRLSEFRGSSIEKLTCAGIERPAYVVDMLISKFADIPTAHIVTHADFDIPQDILHKIETAIEQRLQRVPLSYILGEAEFYGYKFKVGKGCLIPRPETELLAEKLLELAPNDAYFADWCTGSGCIAIAMLLERPDFRGCAVDASKEALYWAEENRKLYKLEERLELIENSKPSELKFDRPFDFIAANPPYIPSDEIPGLMKDVLEYEPEMALNGGAEGVEIYELLFETLPEFIKRGGYFGFEIAGDKQAEIIKQKLPITLEITAEIRDYSGILRHLICIKK